MNLTPLERFRIEAMRELVQSTHSVLFTVDSESLVVHKDQLLTGIGGKLLIYTDSTVVTFIAMISAIKGDPDMKAAFDEALRFVNSGGIVESSSKTKRY